ncbi:VIR protein [Plasmodium vivax]|uniref:VIR protein n=1 Tax=Plasmodium vivax TaxID=5855 RepID=A0A1G4E9H6_PLAVI|nr:VIR protein [Plasmodium vivax]
MFKTRKDDFFAKLEEKYSFLWHFPLSGTYTLFLLSDNAEASISGLCSVLSKEDSKCDFSSICTSAGTLLLRLSDKSGKQTISNFSKVCEYLNYWIYYIIKDSLTCDNIGSLYQRLDGIKQSFIQEGNTCDIHNFKIGKEEFLTKKKLFFHAEILDWIKNGYEHVNKGEETLYNKYLNECLNIYKGIICDTHSEKKENYLELLDIFKTNFNNAITSLKQKGISIWPTINPLDNESLCLNKSPRTATGSELPVGPGEQEGQGQLGRTSESRGLQLQPEVSGLAGTLGPLGAADLGDQGSRDQGINGNLPEEVRTSKGGTIASSLAGSCFFLGMMYKFTPMGSWINTKVLGRNKLMDNMKKNHYELLLNDAGNREMSLNDTMYHISYNSAAN